MTVSTIEESELPEYQTVFTVVHTTTPNSGTGVTNLVAAGHHPKCRLVRGQAIARVYATGVDVLAIEDGGGTDAATVSASATVHTPVALTLVKDQYFERNESINVNITTQGSATNATDVHAMFESIH